MLGWLSDASVSASRRKRVIASESCAKALQYGPTEGLPETKHCIAEVMDAEGMQVDPEDVIVTIYSLLGIDWTKKITNTPSGRAFEYIEQQSGTDFVRFREISNLFA